MKLFKREKVEADDNTIVYKIGGMSCNHCKMSVEKAIKNLENVEDCTVDLGKNIAIVKGQPGDENVKKAVEEIGFEYKGLEK